jgi:hypothetical protein
MTSGDVTMNYVVRKSEPSLIPEKALVTTGKRKTVI